MSASLTGQTPKNTYTQLAHFGDDGAFPADGETPQKLYKGDGTESPISMTVTKVFVNGVEIGTTASILTALGITSYADLPTANASLPIGTLFYNTATETLAISTV